MTELRARQWRFHPDRDRLLAEAHARVVDGSIIDGKTALGLLMTERAVAHG